MKLHKIPRRNISKELSLRAFIFSKRARSLENLWVNYEKLLELY